LAATLSPSWGVYSGFELYENEPASPDNEEYRHSEKYELRSRDWDRADSLWPFLGRLNQLRRDHRSLWRLDSLRFHHVDAEAVIAYSHHHPASGDTVVCVVNLDPVEVREATVTLDLGALGLHPDVPYEVRDGLTGESWTWRGPSNYVRLDPAERVGHVFAIVRG
jgi:starch synthase (maltosyl-transferring)